jgi:hypothetical protein
MLILLAFPASALSRDERGVEIWATGQVHDASWGNYHALIIGINAYKEWRPLKTAVKDAQSLKKILIRRYGFAERNVILRTDRKATRLGLIGDLRNMASSLGSKDNLLIYFAGHGQLDDLTGDGYWIPVEGKLKNPGTWISHSTVKNILSSERVRGKNIVVVADSCYSGTLLRGGPSLLSLTDQGYREKLVNLASCRSRQVITSGGVEPVADGGRDGHSLFAYYFLKSLKENDRDVIDLENLFHTYVWKPVTEIGGQRPNVGRLKTPMDEDGQFVLASSGVTVSQPGTTTLSVECNVPDADVFVDSRQMGTTPVRDLELSGGTYRLRVEKDGYEPYRKRVRLEVGQSITLHVDLSEERPRTGRLFVEIEPADAKVKILNILPKFYQGIELDPGRYHIEVSSDGYETKDMWVALESGQDKDIDVRLQKNPYFLRIVEYSKKISHLIKTVTKKDRKQSDRKNIALAKISILPNMFLNHKDPFITKLPYFINLSCDDAIIKFIKSQSSLTMELNYLDLKQFRYIDFNTRKVDIINNFYDSYLKKGDVFISDFCKKNKIDILFYFDPDIFIGKDKRVIYVICCYDRYNNLIQYYQIVLKPEVYKDENRLALSMAPYVREFSEQVLSVIHRR